LDTTVGAAKVSSFAGCNPTSCVTRNFWSVRKFPESIGLQVPAMQLFSYYLIYEVVFKHLKVLVSLTNGDVVDAYFVVVDGFVGALAGAA
jgi:hypothetical protein